MNYILEYPIWYLALCILCGALYTFILYAKEKLLDEVPRWQKVAMSLLRFSGVTLIAFLLLGILIKKESKVVEKPIIVVGHDNSISPLLSKDSTYYNTEYLSNFNRFVDRLSANYQVELYSFGDDLKTQDIAIDFSEKQSDLSLFLTEVSNRFQNRNIGAVVMASDGIFNKGFDPVSMAASITNTGIYTIALGDTTLKRDLLVQKISANKVAYLGNDFPVEILVKADKLNGKTSNIELLHNGKIIESQIIDIDQSVLIKNFAFRLPANRAGVQKYTVRLKPVDGEFTYDNNNAVFFVDVQNNREKILLLGHSPHPDLGAIKSAIESNDAYQVELKFAGDFNNDIGPYGLVLLHQLPSRKYPSGDLMNKIIGANKPTWFILGSQTNFSKFNTLKTGLTHIGYRGELDPVTPQLNPNFTLFNLTDDIKSDFALLPVIHVPFGTLKTSGSVTTLFSQKVGGYDKGVPLVAFNQWSNTRTAFTAGEGMWRWRIAEPDLFRGLVQKITQYLATKEDKSFFRVLGKSEFLENERVTFDAELFNQSYELTNTGVIKMEIVGENGNKYDYDFSINGRGYRLSAGMLPVGKYTYNTTAKLNGKTYEKAGEFSVKQIRAEYANTVANHQMLYNLAHGNGGEMVFPNELDLLYDKIMSREDLVSVSYPYTDYDDIINWKWLFYLIVGLLCLEWFLRKRNGAY